MTAKFHKMHPDARMPVYATSGSAGADLFACIEKQSHRMMIGSIVIIPTGLRVDISAGYELQIRPRSGLAAKHGITVLNAPATIDSDFKGEIKVILINHGPKPFLINDGDRIAQAVLARVERIDCPVSDAVRGEGGFGSTGTGEIK